MKCPKCNCEFSDAYDFCPSCGVSVRKVKSIILSPEDKESLTPPEDLNPEAVDFLKNTIWYRSEIRSHNLPKIMLKLVEIFASQHCKIRFECNTRGVIRTCLSCFCDHVLYPDMFAAAGNDFLMWQAKLAPGSESPAPPSPKGDYQCLGNPQHRFPSETAESFGFKCPACRRDLRKVKEVKHGKTEE